LEEVYPKTGFLRMKPPKGSSRFAILLKEIIRTNHKKLRLFYAVFKVSQKWDTERKKQYFL
jgi:hypothetical protein